MAIYAIGDIQGCYDSFMKLLEKIEFNKTKDTLWLVGDLVNRGDKSLEVLKFLYSIKESVISTLGNHDIRALASYFEIKKPNRYLSPIFKDIQKEEILEWLRERPLLYFNENFILSHAGIYPFWDLKEALNRAKEIEDILRSENAKEFLNFYYSNEIIEDKKDNSFQRASFALKTFTMMRFLTKDGKLDLKCKINPKENKNQNLIPWFKIESKTKQKKIFGHWAALGLYKDDNVFCIDSGCVWGNYLTALKIDKNPQFFQVKCSNNK